jgi:hypothetical protein
VESSLEVSNSLEISFAPWRRQLWLVHSVEVFEDMSDDHSRAYMLTVELHKKTSLEDPKPCHKEATK